MIFMSNSSFKNFGGTKWDSSSWERLLGKKGCWRSPYSPVASPRTEVGASTPFHCLIKLIIAEFCWVILNYQKLRWDIFVLIFKHCVLNSFLTGSSIMFSLLLSQVSTDSLDEAESFEPVDIDVDSLKTVLTRYRKISMSKLAKKWEL